MCYNQTGDISTLDGTPIKLVDKFTYLGSSVESTKKDIKTRLTKAWTAIDRLLIIWKSDLTDKMKRSFFQAVVTSILLYGCTTWTVTKRLEKKQDGNYTRMLRAILNKSWRQHPTRHQLYSHLPPITKTIQVRWTRHAGHCWRSRDELIRDVLLWTPIHGRAKARRPAWTYIQQLCEYTGCCPEDLPRAMNDREKWRERVRDIRATSTIWWWWWNNKCSQILLWCQSFEYTDCIPCTGIRPRPKTGVSSMTLNCVWFWGSCSGDLRSVKYPFVTITTSFTLTLSTKSDESPIFSRFSQDHEVIDHLKQFSQSFTNALGHLTYLTCL